MNEIKLIKLSIVLSCQSTRFEAVAFKGDFERNLGYLSRLGYDGVELAIRNPDEMDYPALYQLLDRFRLKVPALGTGQAWGEEHLSLTDPDRDVREGAIQRVLAHIPSAAKLNALVIIGLLRGKIHPDINHEQALDWLTDGLQRCTRVAAQKGVRLCLEPINRKETNFINTVEAGLELIGRVGAENLGLLLDTYHLNTEGDDISASIRKTGNRLFHFHVADDNRWYPGAGIIDFTGILRTLRDVGFDGYISGEFMPMPDPDTAAERGLRNLRKIYSAL